MSAMPIPTLLAAGDQTLALYEWGRRTGARTLVLLHGYPDSASVWAEVAPRLAERFHVVAYDMRGVGLSGEPAGPSPYRFDVLLGDLAAVVDAVSPDRPVHLAGHDWGALLGWEAVLGDRLSGRIASFSTAAPSLDHVGLWFHAAWREGTLAGYGRFLRRAFASSYMLMIQVPLLPEWTWRLGLARLWPRIVARLEGIRPVPRQGLLRDAVNGLGIYRANLLPALRRPRQRRTSVPVQVLEMGHDPFVPPTMFEGLEASAPGLRRTALAGGHWAMLADAAAFALALGDFAEKA